MRSPASLVFVTGVALMVTLGAQTPQTPTPPAGRGGRGGAGQGVPPPSRGGGGGGGTAGPADKPLVDFTAAERGKEVWIAECISCHGAQARGTDNGPNLIRSVLMLRDRYGNEIGPFLKKGHPM
jgi:mono/diheme cytochrome c family protein